MAGFGEKTNSNIANKQKERKSGNLQDLRRALKFHKAGDLEKAERIYEKAIKDGLIHEVVFYNLDLSLIL